MSLIRPKQHIIRVQVVEDAPDFDSALLKKAKTPPRRPKPKTVSPGGRQGVDAMTGKASKGLRHFSMKVSQSESITRKAERSAC